MLLQWIALRCGVRAEMLAVSIVSKRRLCDTAIETLTLTWSVFLSHCLWYGTLTKAQIAQTADVPYISGQNHGALALSAGTLASCSINLSVNNYLSSLSVLCRLIMEWLAAAAAKGAAGATAAKAIHASFEMDVSDWNLSRKVKALARAKTVLGLNRNNPVYIKTPLINAIEHVLRVSGTIYVAVVPPGQGKTTSANAILRCFPSQGIAICPGGDASLTYHEKFSNALSIQSSKKGWMKIFLTSLHEAATSDNSRYILILDEFLAGLSADGQLTPEIKYDLTFLFHIKSLITEWNICVIVLTPDGFAAGLALGINGLSGIVPLPGLYQGQPTLVTQSNLKIGQVQWNVSIWPANLLIDLVILRHGKFFDRNEIRQWIQTVPNLSSPRSILRHAQEAALQRDLNYIAAPSDPEDLPADFSSTVLRRIDTESSLFLGCIPLNLH